MAIAFSVVLRKVVAAKNLKTSKLVVLRKMVSDCCVCGKLSHPCIIDLMCFLVKLVAFCTVFLSQVVIHRDIHAMLTSTED